MEKLLDIGLLIGFYTEVYLLTRMERVVWRTLYTPLNALSLPYTFFLTLTLLMPSSFGLVSFYYPSLLVWMAGLLLMAIPSWLLGAGFRKRFGEAETVVEPPKKELFFLIATLVLILPFGLRLREMMASSLDMLGSDEFGENFAVYGVFGHLLHFLIACSILCFACVRKGRRLLPVAAIVLIAALAFINQVKSWVFIPIIAGFWMCLLGKKMKLSFRFLLSLAVGGLVLFVGSYLAIFILGNGIEYDEHMGEYIGEHVVHYLTSGVLGLSEDLRRGILEAQDPHVLFAPFVNFVRYFTGDAYINVANPYYLEISTNNSLADNVRTYFGTMYIYCPVALYCLLVVLFGFFFYLIRIAALRAQSVYLSAIDGWFCALLAMGWFEYYFFHLSTFEVPLYLLLMFIIEKALIPKKTDYGNDSNSQL
ncbi:MAG: hypothetical protein IJP76_05435 [Paludibacteraceae bacterium]|nr:hypothetical protein [Paludibacteraceae bacterium]